MLRNLSVRTDRRTGRKTVTVYLTNQRTNAQVERGYCELRMDGRSEGRIARKQNASGAYRRRHKIYVLRHHITVLIILNIIWYWFTNAATNVHRTAPEPSAKGFIVARHKQYLNAPSCWIDGIPLNKEMHVYIHSFHDSSTTCQHHLTGLNQMRYALYNLDLQDCWNKWRPWNVGQTDYMRISIKVHNFLAASRQRFLKELRKY